MKKIILVILVLVFVPHEVSAQTKQVILDSCVQGDQIKFKNSEGFVTTYQLHSIISPSTNHITKGEEVYSKEALNYTCNRLTNATSIEVEEVETLATDHNEAYVFIDSTLLQEELLRLGYAKITQLEEDNPYYEILAQAEKDAKENGVGIWKKEDKIVGEVLEIIEKEEKITSKKKKNPIMNFFDGVLDGLVAGINKMLDSILQKINNML